MNKTDRKEYAKLERQKNEIAYKLNLIKAQYVKDIWTDKTYDKDRKDHLRNAELTLRLDADTKYKSLLSQIWDLEEEQDKICDRIEYEFGDNDLELKG